MPSDFESVHNDSFVSISVLSKIFFFVALSISTVVILFISLCHAWFPHNIPFESTGKWVVFCPFSHHFSLSLLLGLYFSLALARSPIFVRSSFFSPSFVVMIEIHGWLITLTKKNRSLIISFFFHLSYLKASILQTFRVWNITLSLVGRPDKQKKVRSAKEKGQREREREGGREWKWISLINRWDEYIRKSNFFARV